MVIVVRIDLDRYDIEEIEAFVRDGVVTIQEARDSRAVKALDEYAELMWTRKMQSERDNKISRR